MNLIFYNIIDHLEAILSIYFAFILHCIIALMLP